MYRDQYPIWQAGDENGKSLAQPFADGTVCFTVNRQWSRAEWEEFKEQVDELFTIAERNDEA
jgi:hypothetical protein